MQTHTVVVIHRRIALLAMFGMLLAYGCEQRCGGNAREIYICEIEQKVDLLIERMADARGMTTTKATVLIGGQSVDEDVEIAKIVLVAPAAMSLNEHFSRVPMSLVMELGSQNTDEWTKALRQTVEKQRGRLAVALDKLEHDVRASPDHFSRSNVGFYGSGDPYTVGEYFGWTDSDEFFLRALYTSEQVFVGRVLAFDVDEWLASISNMVTPDDAQN